MSFSISGAFNMLAVDPPEEEAVVCAGRDEGKVTTMAHSSNGAMWQRFLKEARVAARSIASNKDPPYQVAWALNLRDECTTESSLITSCHPATRTIQKTQAHLAALCARVCIQPGSETIRSKLPPPQLVVLALDVFHSRPELASSAVLADDSLDWSIRAPTQVK